MRAVGDERPVATWNTTLKTYTHAHNNRTHIYTQVLTTSSTFISNFGEYSTSFDIREGPVLQNERTVKERQDVSAVKQSNTFWWQHFARDAHLILGGAEQVVPCGVEREPGDASLVGADHLDTVAPSDGPDTDGGVWRCRENHRLEGEREQG